MNKPLCKHHDAWGHPILPILTMRKYYQNNPQAIQILARLLPHRYVVIPRVIIQINPHDVSTFYVWRIYPGGSEVTLHNGSVRVVEALRATYRKKRAWNTCITPQGFVQLSREGTIIEEPTGKFYPRA